MAVNVLTRFQRQMALRAVATVMVDKGLLKEVLTSCSFAVSTALETFRQETDESI